ncbi:hypothetical protein V8G61_11155 [Gaetbulibacter sp. M240]|uniref:hypothetical protein n=1 Tax=Gaetbulibacter sp. M240 TaxID=3126511 RepID=UPI00374EDDEF
MRKLYLLIVLLTFQNIFCQVESAEIILNYNFSAGEENLEINLNRNSDSTKVTIDSKKILEYFYSKKQERKVIETVNRNFYISNEVFDDLLKQIKAISKSGLNKNTIVIDNGKITTITVKNDKMNIYYEVIALNMENSEGELKKFLNVCVKILDIGNFKPENYFD